MILKMSSKPNHSMFPQCCDSMVKSDWLYFSIVGTMHASIPDLLASDAGFLMMNIVY